MAAPGEFLPRSRARTGWDGILAVWIADIVFHRPSAFNLRPALFSLER
jgi:hypothetical protein